MGDKTVTRADLAEAVFRKIGLSRTESAHLVESVIEEIVVTDTIPVPEGSAGGKIQILSVDRILSDTIHNVFCDESVSEIFAGENQLF